MVIFPHLTVIDIFVRFFNFYGSVLRELFLCEFPSSHWLLLLSRPVLDKASPGHPAAEQTPPILRSRAVQTFEESHRESDSWKSAGNTWAGPHILTVRK